MASSENGASKNGAGGDDALSELRNSMTTGYIHDAYKEWCIEHADLVGCATEYTRLQPRKPHLVYFHFPYFQYLLCNRKGCTVDRR